MTEHPQDLAMKTLTELMFPPDTLVGSSVAALLVEIIEEYDGPPSVLEQAIREVSCGMTMSLGQTQSAQMSKLVHLAGRESRHPDTVKSLIDRLIDATEESDFVSLRFDLFPLLTEYEGLPESFSSNLSPLYR